MFILKGILSNLVCIFKHCAERFYSSIHTTAQQHSTGIFKVSAHHCTLPLLLGGMGYKSISKYGRNFTVYRNLCKDGWVATPTEEDPEKTTPFNQLSKSGKVLNAYNALLMAARISKGNRK
jgi:hypothetical protein